MCVDQPRESARRRDGTAPPLSGTPENRSCRVHRAVLGPSCAMSPPAPVARGVPGPLGHRRRAVGDWRDRPQEPVLGWHARAAHRGRSLTARCRLVVGIRDPRPDSPPVQGEPLVSARGQTEVLSSALRRSRPGSGGSGLRLAEPAAGPVLQCANALPAGNHRPDGAVGGGSGAGPVTALTESPQTASYHHLASGPPCGPCLRHAAVTDEENQ